MSMTTDPDHFQLRTKTTDDPTAREPRRIIQALSASARARGHRTRGPALRSAWVGILLMASIGCAGDLGPVSRSGAGGVAPADASMPRLEAGVRGRVFSTVDEAAFVALQTASRQPRAGNRRRLQLGTIRRVPTGFVFSAPLRSDATLDSLATMKIRFRMGPNDVAIYVVHPRSGHRVIDRRNEEPTPRERRLVDHMDPLHRPLYVLTPSYKIVRYRHGPSPVTVVDQEGVEGRLRSTLHAQSQ